jgi:hypothetical protein
MKPPTVEVDLLLVPLLITKHAAKLCVQEFQPASGKMLESRNQEYGIGPAANFKRRRKSCAALAAAGCAHAVAVALP